MKVRGLNLYTRPVQIISLTLPLFLTKGEATQHIPVPLWSNYADLKDHAVPTGQELRDFAIADLASHDE